jgi:hypothetical protein
MMLSWRKLVYLKGFLVLGWMTCTGSAQEMPVSITGLWRITKVLPTHNPACWDKEQAAKLVGSTLRYQQGSMVWQGGSVEVPEALSRTLSRRKFQDEYKVDLSELGIKAESVTEIDLQHEDADITGATTEVPGDTVVLAGPGRIVVSACGVFYEAVRAAARAAARGSARTAGKAAGR